jgi:hypothetical protein
VGEGSLPKQSKSSATVQYSLKTSGHKAIAYCRLLHYQGVGATKRGVQAAMQVPCAAEHTAAALVSQAHQPTGPVEPNTIPEEA